jgi:hypothetical protein
VRNGICSLRILLIVLALLLVALVLPAQVPGPDCSNLVMNRTYAGNFSGYMNVPLFMNFPDNGTVGVVPNAGAGTVTFLPGGRVSNTETIAIGLLGLHKDTLITGTYNLAWDVSKKPAVCVGAIHESDGALAYDFQLLVTANGDRIEMIHTNAGLVVGTSMFPLNAGTCRNASMKGTYTYNTTGWALASPGTPADQMLSAYIPGAMSGAMHFDANTPPDPIKFPDAVAGAGSLSGWDTLSVNGTILTRSMTGWYKVNPDCSVAMVAVDTLGYPPFHIEGFIARGSSTVYAANIDTMDLESGPVPMFLMPITLTRTESGH